MCQDEFDFKAVMRNFERMDIAFESLEQADEVIQIVRDLANNTKNMGNNGYTPKEIFEKFEKPY